MGFMEYLKKLMDQQVNSENLLTGKPDTRTVGERLRAGGEWVPGPSDVISGYDAVEAFKKGNYGEAALNAVGILPGIPAMAGVIRKSSESMVPEFAYKDWETVPESRNEELVQNTLNALHQKWAKSAGSETDPFYKLIEEGKINSENMDEVFGGANEIAAIIRERPEFMSRLEQFGGYGGQYDRLPHWTKMLEDFRDNLDLPPNVAKGEGKMIYDLYDANLLAPNLEDVDFGKFLSKENFQMFDFTDNLTNKEQKFFDKLNDQDMVAMDLSRNSMPLFGDQGKFALMRALQKGNITPSSLADNRIGISGLIDFTRQYKDELMAEGAKVPPEDILNTFDTGHQWMELKNPQQLEFEGNKMSNCVGGYCDKVEKGDSRIFSLRNAEGTPKVTAEWDPRSRTFPQMFGPGNSTPKEKYRDMMDWLISQSIDW